MTFLLILQIWAGFVLIGEFDSEKNCQEGAVAYIALLAEWKSDDKHNAKAMCVGVPNAMPQPREFWNA
jgi:hypothetical protein